MTAVTRFRALSNRLENDPIYRRITPPLAVLALVIAIVATAWSASNDRAQVKANTANQVTSCENANESREAARTLWSFALDAALAGNPDASEQDIAYVAAFQDYVDAVYRQRDCSDLGRRYELPPPPTLP